LDRQAQMLRSDDLQELIEAARQMARAGGREGAMQMLAELQRMLDGIRAGLRGGGGGADLAEAQAMLQTLRELGERQQRLLDDSFRRLQEQRPQQERGPRPPSGRQAPRDRAMEPPPGPGLPGIPRPMPGPITGPMPGPMPGPIPGPMTGPAPGPSTGAAPGARPGTGRNGAATAEQQALRGELGELMLRLDQFLGGIPQPLGEADRAMKGAVDALGQNHLGEAVPNQTRAADALQRATEAAGRALAQRLGQGMAMGEDGGGGSDIFGRRPDGRRGYATGSLKIPDRGSIQRAQEILDELRRRAAERSRPADELDYLERLLRRF
ncbi:MAG TPA: DUF4175 family protein, partial [Rhodospirillales bacterium]|nr:DUF4175 family protein [Rhodospirillales bacterium]